MKLWELYLAGAIAAFVGMAFMLTMQHVLAP